MLRGTAGVHRADAIVLAGYGGEEAGTGLADVIFGRYNPAGRLPYTVPTGLEQLPPFESYQMDRGSCGDAACGRTYRATAMTLATLAFPYPRHLSLTAYWVRAGYMDKPPLFHFGSGQSYSTFTTRKLSTSASAVTTTSCSVVNVSVEVTNTGQVAGDEVTQLYIQRNGTSAEAPHLALAAFARTHIAAGETATVVLPLRPAALAVVEPRGRQGWQLQPCTVTLFVGGRQPSAPAPDNNPADTVQVGTLRVSGAASPLGNCPGSAANFIA